MKTKFIILAIFLIAPAFKQFIWAQEKQNVIKTSLIFPVGKVFDVSYERVLNNEMSLVAEGGIGEAAYFSPQFRYYLTAGRIAPDGSYISPFFLLGDFVYGGGLLVGHQGLFKNIITLEANIGPFITDDGVSVWGGINIGFAF